MFFSSGFVCSTLRFSLTVTCNIILLYGYAIIILSFVIISFEFEVVKLYKVFLTRALLCFAAASDYKQAAYIL